MLVAETDTFTIWNDAVEPEVRYGLDWSPDGTKALWHHAETESSAGTLRVTDISDPTTSTLLTSTVAGLCGVWSSQDEIAWISGGVRRILADGSGEETLYTARKNESLSFLTWSPDGEHLAYVSDGNKVVIYTLAVDNARRSSTGAKGRPKRWLAE